MSASLVRKNGKNLTSEKEKSARRAWQYFGIPAKGPGSLGGMVCAASREQRPLSPTGYAANPRSRRAAAGDALHEK